MGLKSKHQLKKSGPGTLTMELVTPPAFEIGSYSLAHAYNQNLNDQEENATYLSSSRWCRRMVLQPSLKVSVLDAFVYDSTTSIDPGLMWNLDLKLHLCAPNSSRTSA